MPNKPQHLYAYTDPNTDATLYTTAYDLNTGDELYDNTGVTVNLLVGQVSVDKTNFNIGDVAVTINTTPNDATINSDVGTVIGNVCTVPYNTTFHYTVSRVGYATSSQQTAVGDYIKTITAPALVKNNYTLTVNPTPADAIVTLTAAGYSQVGNSITVPYETVVTYSVSHTGYAPSGDQTYTVTSNATIQPSLTPYDYTLTLTTNPSDATVTFNTQGIVSGKSITVPYGTVVSYNVSRTGYATLNNQTYTVTQTETVAAPALTINNYTLTVNPTPADAIVVLAADGYTQSGNSITVPYNTNVTYSVYKTGYINNSGDMNLTSNQTLNISLPQINGTYVNGFTSAGTDTYVYKASDNRYYVENDTNDYSDITSQTSPGYLMYFNYHEYDYEKGRWSSSKDYMSCMGKLDPSSDFAGYPWGNYYINVKTLPTSEVTSMSGKTFRQVIANEDTSSYGYDYVYINRNYRYDGGSYPYSYTYYINDGTLIRDMNFDGIVYNGLVYGKKNTIQQSTYTYKAWVNPDNAYDIIYTDQEADYYLYTQSPYNNLNAHRNDTQNLSLSRAMFFSDGNTLYYNFETGQGEYTSLYENKYTNISESYNRVYKYVRSRANDTNTLPLQITLAYEKRSSFIYRKLTLTPGSTLGSGFIKPSYTNLKVNDPLGDITYIKRYTNYGKTTTYNPNTYVPTESTTIYAIIGMTPSSCTIYMNLVSWTEGTTNYTGYNGNSSYGSIVSGNFLGVGQISYWYKYGTSSGSVSGDANIGSLGNKSFTNEYGRWNLNVRYDNNQSAYYTDNDWSGTYISGVDPWVPCTNGQHRFDFWMTAYGTYSEI